MNERLTQESHGSGDEHARDRLAAVAYIASLIGHEARNRLATLRAALELIDAGLEGNLSREYRATLLRELDEFIGDFNLGLDMIRCDCATLETMPTPELVAEALDAIRPLATRRGIPIAVVFGPGVEEIRTDRRLMRMTLLNLLRNAVEALADTKDPRIELRVLAARGALNFEIEDNGPGVASDMRNRLFRRMDQNRRSGSGLGLSLCRDAMVLLGGSIQHVTPPGRPGACFRVSLPTGD